VELCPGRFTLFEGTYIKVKDHAAHCLPVRNKIIDIRFKAALRTEAAKGAGTPGEIFDRLLPK